MKSVILLAPPAGGKGTFSKALASLGYVQISTGDLLREEALKDDVLASNLAQGQLASDELVFRLLEEKLSSVSSSVPVVFDGIPRTLQQGEKLDIILTGLKRDVVVIYIDVEKKILLDRVLGRRICKKCHRSYNVLIQEFKPKEEGLCDDCLSPLSSRSDDTLEAFEHRYAEFLEKTYPLVAYYQEKGCLTVLQNNDVDQTETLKTLMEVLNDNS